MSEILKLHEKNAPCALSCLKQNLEGDDVMPNVTQDICQSWIQPSAFHIRKQCRSRSATARSTSLNTLERSADMPILCTQSWDMIVDSKGYKEGPTTGCHLVNIH